jgi:N-ethylmaleimide reductase
MAPMTRNRAEANGDPNDLMRQYYEQRNSFGLIITEGTAPALVGTAYPMIPGIYTDSQRDHWRPIVDVVHAGGAKIFMQLMHSGRISHILTTGMTPWAPSAVKPKAEIYTPEGTKEIDTPHEMTEVEVGQAIEDFVHAAKNAIEAGFDGIELHSANGYLLHQFLADNTNLRTDRYGGSAEKRTNFVVEVSERVVQAIGAEKVGIRISPAGVFNDIHETETEATYSILLTRLAPLNLAYLHVATQPAFDGIEFARKHWSGTLMVNSGYSDKTKVETATKLVEEGIADIFSFGRIALANPDLPRRLKEGLSLNEADPKTFYSRGPVGYTDYPAIS